MPDWSNLPLSNPRVENLIRQTTAITQPQVDAWSAQLHNNSGESGALSWVGQNPVTAFGIGAAVLLLLLAGGRRR